MKKLITVIFIIFPCILIAQELSYYPGEMYLGTRFVDPPTQTLTFTIEAQGKVWAGSYPPRTYWITDDYDVSTFTLHENNEWPPNQQWRGWDFVTDITSNPPYYIPIYAYGLYKLSTNHSSEYFYLDFRDDRYGYYILYPPPSFGHAIDLWIKYDANTQKFSYSSTGSASVPFITVSNAELIPVWEMKQKGQPNTSLFPSYWENCLAILKSTENHPLLVWGPYPFEGFVERINYQIWRKYGALDWAIIDVVSESDPNYEDESLSITGQGPGTTVLYKVRTVEGALPNNPISDFTNVASIIVDGYDPGKINVSQRNNQKSKYKLFQNYPNPFNPLTTIEFSLEENSFVTLKVFNVLGSEVATLVNEKKEAGTYSVKFTAEGLPSGIYLYKIEGDRFSENRKMIILK